jgi:hypothetical protein
MRANGGNSVKGKVVLIAPAPAGGVLVKLARNVGAISIPASVLVPEGATEATFPINTFGQNIGSSTSVLVRAQAPDGTFRYDQIVVVPPTLASLGISPSTIHSGQTATALLVLNGKAGPAGETLQVSSSDGSLTVPKSVTVPPGASSIKFQCSVSTVSASKQASITVSDGFASISTAVTLAP